MENLGRNYVYTLYISDEAYKELTTQARMLGYIRSPNVSRGLSAYVDFLMECELTDTRPDDVREQDAEMLSAGISPDWRMYSPRPRRRLALNAETLAASAAHCLTLGIAYPTASRIISAPTHFDVTACMSALLEAIGTEWVSAKVKQSSE